MGDQEQLAVYDPSATTLHLERAAARARTSTSVVLQQLSCASASIAEWIEYYSEEGYPYYYNEATGESRWTLPVPETLGLSLEGLSEQLGDESLLRQDNQDEASSSSDSSLSEKEEAEPLLLDARKQSNQHEIVPTLEAAVGTTSSSTCRDSMSTDKLILHEVYTRRRASLQAEAEEEARSERELEEVRAYQRAREVVCDIVEEALESCIGEHTLRARREAQDRQRELRRGSRAQYRINKLSSLVSHVSATNLDAEDDDDNDDHDDVLDVPKSDLQFGGDFKTLATAKISNACHLVTSNTKIRILELSDCGLKDDDMPRITKILGRSLVVSLFLNKNMIASPGVKALCPAARSCPSMRELHLNSNRVGDEGLRAICTSFLGSPFTHLDTLNLAANPISVEGAKHLSLSLVRQQQKISGSSLRLLRLGACSASKSMFKTQDELRLTGSQREKPEYIGNRGTVAIAASLLAPGTVLISLSLCNCGIGADGARALAAMLYCEPPLRHLDLTENLLEGSGEISLAATTGKRKTRAATLQSALTRVPSPAKTIRGIPDMVPAGGVAALARALEVTTTLRECLVSNLDLQEYFSVLIRTEPPADWHRRKSLGEDAASLREWLLDVAASNLNFGIPEVRATPLPHAKTSDDRHHNNMKEKVLSDTDESRWRLLLTALLDVSPKLVDDSILLEMNTNGPPLAVSWSDLSKAASTVDKMLTQALSKADADEAIASVVQNNSNFVHFDDNSLDIDYDAYTVLSEEIAQRLELKRAEVAVETEAPKLETMARRQEMQIAQAEALCADTRRKLIVARTEAKLRSDELALTQRQQQGAEDARVLEARATLHAATRDLNQMQCLVDAASARLVVLQSARARTAKILTELQSKYSSKCLQHALSAELLEQAEMNEDDLEFRKAEIANHITEIKTAVAKTKADMNSIACQSRARASKLREILSALKTAVQSRYETDLRSEIVPQSSGDEGLDKMLAAARLEEQSASADLCVANAILAESTTSRSFTSALRRRVSAQARCDAAREKIEELRRDTAALVLARSHQATLDRTLAAHHTTLVRAISPIKPPLAAPFAAATVHAAVTLEQHRHLARQAREQAQAKQKQDKAELRAELKSLRQLSPRTQLQAITRRIDMTRSVGYPTTREGITRLRKLRGCKARAKEALRKQRKNNAAPS